MISGLGKRLGFVVLERKLCLGTKEDEKKLVVKRPRVESTKYDIMPRVSLMLNHLFRTAGLLVERRSWFPFPSTEVTIYPRERLGFINAPIERDLAGRKERDHGYEET